MDTPSDSGTPTGVDLSLAERGDWLAVRPKEPSLMDQHVLAALQRRLEEFVAAGKPRLVLDFKHVEYISSAMVGLLVAVRKSATDVGGDVVLCGLNDRLTQLVKLMRLDKVFRIEPDVNTAMKAVGAV